LTIKEDNLDFEFRYNTVEFAYTHGNILALETSDGKTLWHSGTGAPMQTSPITYELDGRQYVVTGSGGVMFAWALP
jgi:alcohol dehydrogenase (cytochrome c)